MRELLATTVILYVVVMFAISLRMRGRITSAEDYLVAGRKLPLMLAWPSLFATWFGAETILTSAEEVRAGGMVRAALDPFGAGVCLILAGLFFAAPLWRMKLTTLPDFYRRRFGLQSELTSALIMVPGYFGWIAAQFVALAAVLELFFGIDPAVGVLLVAVVGTGYTLIGGMWSVTLTDALQVVMIIAGLVVLSVTVAMNLGDGDAGAGLTRFFTEVPPDKLRIFPEGTSAAVTAWLAAFTVGALGNIPGQDLTQRVFASRSPSTARNACLVAGVVYISVGLLPMFLALSSELLGVPGGHSIIPAMASMFLHPALAVLFVVALMSAVLSTIDSAILSPAGVLAQNVFSRWEQDRYTPLQLNKLAVVAVAGASLALAYVGESAYSLIESAYELGMAGLLAPLVFGMYGSRGDEAAALTSMVTGVGVWLLHAVVGWDHLAQPAVDLGLPPIPIGVAALGASVIGYLVAARRKASCAP